MSTPEKLAEHSRWLEAHPWWRRGIILWLVLFVMTLAEALRYALNLLR
jgi:hypothetical protein